MWQRYTERARRVVFFAQKEAGRLGKNFVDTELLLLGLVEEQDSIAAVLLSKMGVTREQMREAVLNRVTPGEGRSGQELQLTPNAKRCMDCAYDEARALDNNYIGTEHLLLGLLHDREGPGAHVLAEFKIDLEATRAAIREMQPDAGNKSTQSDVMQWAREGIHSLMKGRLREDIMSTDAAGEPTPGRGHIGVLRNDNERKQVEFVPNAEDVPAFTEVMALKDEFAYRDLVTEGKIMLLAAGTGAKFLRAEKPDLYCVRILDGDHAGKIGYILRQQLKDTRPDDRPFPPEIN